MSFSFRDRPSLGERLRGRSGDQVLEDLEKEIEEDRKMFFDRTPSWNTTPRSGSFSRAFPFDDLPRQDIRSHLEDLANRHPEFAEHLRCPPWGGEVGARSSRWDRKQPSTEYHRDEDTRSQASNSSSTGSDAPREAEKQGGLSHHGLRNTVDIGQQQHSSEQTKEPRGQRSMSAPPPDNRSQNSEQAPPRYVTRLNITPSNNAENARNDQRKPPVAPKLQQPQQPSSPKQQSSSNVRHIPIFVEGRDEPVFPKNMGESSYASKPPPHFQHPPPPHSFGRPGFNAHHQFEPQPPPQTPPQNRTSQQAPKPQQSPQPPPMPQQQAQQPPPKPHQPSANDPISRVMAVQKDVDELAVKVDQFSGTSRKDKEYIYLDEMLTRNLLKLDDIETDGKENVRVARREAIKAIQKCINILEGKAPLPEEVESTEPMESTEEVNMSTEATEGALAESGDAALAQSLEDKVPVQTMEVVNNESKVDQSCLGSLEKSEEMEVEQVNVSGDSEEQKMMEVESVKGAEAVEEKTVETEGKQSEIGLAEENAETEQLVVVVQAGGAETVIDKAQPDVAVEQVKPENSSDANTCEDGANPDDLPNVDASSETSAVTSEKLDAAASKPVQEVVVSAHEVKANDGNKGSESPRLKGKGAKGKKEGAKTRKGKAGKSAERKSAKAEAEPVASETATERSDAKGGDVSVCADADKVEVVDAVPTA